MMYEGDSSLPLKLIALETAKFLLPIVVGVLAIAGLHYRFFTDNEIRLLQERESVTVDLSTHLLRTETRNIVADAQHLALLAGGHLPFRQKQNLTALAGDFLDFSAAKPMYEQVRLLGPTGYELVRVEIGASAKLIAPEALQDKSSRYYFEQLQGLEAEEVFLSTVGLNEDNGRVERSSKHSILSGLRIVAADGSTAGWILLTFSADQLLGTLKRTVDYDVENLMLLNGEGFWLANPNGRDEWGFMGLDHQLHSSASNTSLWAEIDARDSGQWYAEEGLVTFSTVHPHSLSKAMTGDECPWKVVSLVGPAHLAAIRAAFFPSNMLLYALLLSAGFLIASIGGLLATRNRLAREQVTYERHFREIVQEMKLLAVSLNTQGKVSYCNSHVLEVLQCKSGDVIGRDWFDNFILQKERMQERGRVMSVIEKGKPGEAHQSTVITHSNESLIIDWSVTPTGQDSSGISGLALVGRDVTPQRRTEDELRKLSQAVEQSPNTVMITNTNAEIEYVNPKFTQLTGYLPEEVLGKNPRILQSGETSNTDYQELWDKLSQGEEWRGEFHNRKKTGELYWEATAISAIRDAFGNITHYLALKEDLTENKRLQQEADERKRDSNRNRELAIVGRMANMIAHDMRNPLSSMKMALQIVGKKKEEPETQELIQISLDQIRYMEQMLSDLLSYSKPEALKPEWLSVDKVLDMAVSFSQREIRRQEVIINTDYQAGLPTLYGDRTGLVQVFSNLIVNAIQSTEGISDRVPEIRIGAALLLGINGTSIQVEISDNGLGVDPKMVDQLYEPFFTMRAKGTGLGLAIVKKIVGLHRGTISLEPQSGFGTRVIVVLPIGPVAVNETDYEQVALGGS